MNLYELAFTSYLYANMTGFDEPYQEFQQAIGGNLDLSHGDHRKALFRWLNRWQCRIAVAAWDQMLLELGNWANRHSSTLRGRPLEEFQSTDFVSIEEPFDELCNRPGFGPTILSKICFALRSDVFIPWDQAIYTKKEFSARGSGYAAFLKSAHSDLDGIEKQCLELGFELAELPGILNRPSISPFKFIDEYYWVTITKKCEIPPVSEVRKWITWNGNSS